MKTIPSNSFRRCEILGKRISPLLAALFLPTSMLTAGVHYVDVNSVNPTPPYTSWATAATNIQDAVDAAVDADEVLVTNGVYQTGGRLVNVDGTTNRVAVDKSIAIRSVNGPQFTLIQGFQEPGTTNGPAAIRCVYLVEGASMTGFTLTNGAAELVGGGVLGSTTEGGILNNCVLSGNAAYSGGGAAGCTLNSCALIGNTALGDNYSEGGGAFLSVLNNCTLRANSAAQGGGASSAQANNCLFTGNSAEGGGGACGCLLKNCTLAGNSANYGGGTVDGALTNCIVYFNAAAIQGANFFYNPNISSTVEYCCTTPMPTNGVGNITNAPLFVDSTNGNFRLQSNSPCINAGNNDYVSGLTDVEGKERIVGGTVDVGAYEWIAVPTHYVSLDSPNPTPPYLSWSKAATNVQDAVDVGVAGDDILVTNGVYATGGPVVAGVVVARVAVSRQLNLRSVNGPQFTFIRGSPGVRCVNLSARASLSGFTLTNGSVISFDQPTTLKGGGVFCATFTLNVVSNCVLTGNSADQGGGASGGTLIDCTLTDNSARFDAGGAYGNIFPCVLINCTVTNNHSGFLDGGGGGVYNCNLTNCTLANNSDFEGYGAAGCTLNRCALIGNAAERCNIYNSTLTGNANLGADRCSLYNCTLTGNGIGAYEGSLWNCIIYYNSLDYQGAISLNFCCAEFMPTNGIGNITNAPLFVDAGNGNYRLESNSPCINAGQNAYAAGFTDFDGSPRIAGGTVDIGAYEFQSPSSVLSYAWAQQFGLPTDGSADYADADNDGMNNWQEWIAGTSPTDSSSALRLLQPVQGVSGVTVTWQSVTNRTYSLERTTSVGAQPSFSPIADNIVGQVGTTSYVDTNTFGSSTFFYRVRVK